VLAILINQLAYYSSLPRNKRITLITSDAPEPAGNARSRQPTYLRTVSKNLS